MSAAFAYRIEEIEADASLVAGATKECFDCDPDNPRAVSRKGCTTCAGSGRQPLAAAQIAEELAASRGELATPIKSDGENDGDDGEGGGFDDDLLLEY